MIHRRVAHRAGQHLLAARHRLRDDLHQGAGLARARRPMYQGDRPGADGHVHRVALRAIQGAVEGAPRGGLDVLGLVIAPEHVPQLRPALAGPRRLKRADRALADGERDLRIVAIDVEAALDQPIGHLAVHQHAQPIAAPPLDHRAHREGVVGIGPPQPHRRARSQAHVGVADGDPQPRAIAGRGPHVVHLDALERVTASHPLLERGVAARRLHAGHGRAALPTPKLAEVIEEAHQLKT